MPIGESACERSLLLGTPPMPLLAGYGYGASRSVHQAEFSMIGMSSKDPQAFAGPPDRIVQLNPAARIFAYSDKPGVAGGERSRRRLDLGLSLAAGAAAAAGGGAHRSTAGEMRRPAERA